MRAEPDRIPSGGKVNKPSLMTTQVCSSATCGTNSFLYVEHRPFKHVLTTTSCGFSPVVEALRVPHWVNM